MTILRTQRLVLRRAQADDVDALHEILCDERAMTWWSTPPHERLEQTRAWVQSMIDSPEEISDDFVVTLEGRVIGKLGAHRLPEIGFIFAPRVWGQGFAGEALAVFLTHVFKRPDVNFLTADVDPRNDASLRLLTRHGFVETGRAVGTWRTHLGLCDSVYLRRDRGRVDGADHRHR